LHVITVSERQNELMNMRSQLLVSESRLIGADRQSIFNVLADPAMHSRIDGSGSLRQARAGGPARLSLGATGGMDMHIKRDYKITNTVVEFDEPAVIGWRHFNRHIWRYILTEADAGTLVTEQWDARKAKNRLGLILSGFPNRNRTGIRATLDNLSSMFDGGV
jgi:hypothetical protein